MARLVRATPEHGLGRRSWVPGTSPGMTVSGVGPSGHPLFAGAAAAGVELAGAELAGAGAAGLAPGGAAAALDATVAAGLALGRGRALATFFGLSAAAGG